VTRTQRLGWTQQQFAWEAHVSMSTVQRWEGGRLPPLNELTRIAGLLGIPFDELVEPRPTSRFRSRHCVNGSQPRSTGSLSSTPGWRSGSASGRRTETAGSSLDNSGTHEAPEAERFLKAYEVGGLARRFRSVGHDSGT